MKRIATYLLLFVSFFGMTVWGQNVERKIIIENGHYSFVTIDDYSQIGTLYKGDVGSVLSESKAYALPAGRGISAETNPLAWDFSGDNLVVINFLDHSLNDRNEAIKQIKTSELREWGVGVEVVEILARSMEQEMFALNAPYLFVKERSEYIKGFFFDGILVGEDYWMVMTNNEELTIWKFSSGEWEHGEVKKFPVTNFFHLFEYDNSVLLITNEGEVQKIGLDGMTALQPKSVGFNLTDVTLIEDRDNQKLVYIENSQLNRDKSLNEIMKNSAVNLIRE